MAAASAWPNNSPVQSWEVLIILQIELIMLITDHIDVPSIIQEIYHGLDHVWYAYRLTCLKFLNLWSIHG